MTSRNAPIAVKSRRRQMVFLRERGQAGDRLVAGLENQGKRAFAFVFVDQLEISMVCPFRCY